MPLPRILCIVAATLGLHTASTSPNPPHPDSGRGIAPTGLEFLLASRHLRMMQRILYWSVAVAEAAVIVAQVASPSIWTQQISSRLAFGGDLTQIHFVATPTVALGSLFCVSGGMLRALCYNALGRHFTFELGIFKNHHELVTTGPYSVVRHPGYTGAFLAYFGLMLYYASPGTFIMECVFKSTAGGAFGALYALLMFLVVTGLAWRIPKEDEGLRKEFGEEWEKYAAQVRYVLIPGVL